MWAKSALIAILFCITPPTIAQEVGDSVILQSSNPAGIPMHPADQDNSFVRWPNGSTATVVDIGTWIQVRAPDGDEGWVTRRYVTVISEDHTETDGNEQIAYVVGTWNIEHFKNSQARGFPENLFGGPTYPQSDRDLNLVASIIRDSLQAAILVLNEINGVSGSNPPSSNELDGLMTALGPSWQYVISADGGTLRTAIIHDSSKADRGNCLEFGNASGPRDHIGCFFTFKAPDGTAMNDLVVIGVHLKSGQGRNNQHNAEMADLSAGFAGAFDGDPLPTLERDVVIAGDFNANLYDSAQENFWNDFAGTFDVDVLAPTSFTDYAPTRLARVPLQPNSFIDYVMASSLSGGVWDDLVRSTAHVHGELLTSPFEEFRRKVSDHIPVTIRIRLTADDD